MENLILKVHRITDPGFSFFFTILLKNYQFQYQIIRPETPFN